MITSYEKVVTTAFKVYRKCKERTLKAAASDQGAIEECVAGPNLDSIAADEKGKIAKAVGKLQTTIDKKCAANLFPGGCAG